MYEHAFPEILCPFPTKFGRCQAHLSVSYLKVFPHALHLFDKLYDLLVQAHVKPFDDGVHTL